MNTAAIDFVSPFVSQDPARAHIAKPGRAVFRGETYAVGTDGHRLAAVRSDAVSGVEEARHATTVMGTAVSSAVRLGTIDAATLEAARLLPSSWSKVLTFGCGAGSTARLSASVTRGSKKKQRRVSIIDASVSWGPILEDVPAKAGRAINLPYLVDAVDFVGTNSVDVYGDRLDPLAPLVFVSAGAKPVDAVKLMLVMPVRV